MCECADEDVTFRFEFFELKYFFFVFSFSQILEYIYTDSMTYNPEIGL